MGIIEILSVCWDSLVAFCNVVPFLLVWAMLVALGAVSGAIWFGARALFRPRRAP